MSKLHRTKTKSTACIAMYALLLCCTGKGDSSSAPAAANPRPQEAPPTPIVVSETVVPEHGTAEAYLDKWRVGALVQFDPPEDNSLSLYVRKKEDVVSVATAIGKSPSHVQLIISRPQTCEVATTLEGIARLSLSVELFGIEENSAEEEACLARLAPDFLFGNTRTPAKEGEFEAFLQLASKVDGLRGLGFSGNIHGKRPSLSASDFNAFPKLQYLHLQRMIIKKGALAEAALQLRGLALEDCQLESNGIADVERATQLRNLVLVDVKFEAAVGPGLGALRNIRRLKVHRAHGSWIKGLSHLEQLREIDLSDIRALDPQVVVSMAAAQGLRVLRISRSFLSPENRLALSKLVGLRELVLTDTDFDDASVLTLASLRKLEILDLNENEKLTNGGFASLASHQSLRVFRAGETAVDSAILPILASNLLLEEIDLHDTRVSGELQFLAALKNLHTLRLGDTLIGNRAFKSLPTLPALRDLDLSYSKVTEGPVRRFEKLHPEIEVNWREPGLE